MVSGYSTLVQFQSGTRNFVLYTIIIQVVSGHPNCSGFALSKPIKGRTPHCIAFVTDLVFSAFSVSY